MPELLGNGAPPAKSVSSAAALVTALYILSPAAGLLVEMSLAWKFGASPMVDAFRTAYLLIGFGSQIFVGYLLPHLVVPVISDFRVRGEERIGWQVALSFGQILGIAGLIFAIWVTLFPAPVTTLFAPGLPQKAQTEAMTLLRFFAFAFVVVLWCGVITGILYVHRRFVVSPLSQVICSLCIVVAVVCSPPKNILGVAAGVTCGFAAMLLLHLQFLLRVAKEARIRLRFVFPFAPSASVKRIFLRSMPLLTIVAVTVWTNAFLNREISQLPPGNLSRFGYAMKLMAVTGFAATALATVMFPLLAEAHAGKNEVRFRRLVTRGLRMILILTVPVSGCLFVLRDALVRLLFDRGALSYTGVEQVSFLLGILLVQGVSGPLNFFLLKVLIARDDTQGPALFHVLCGIGLYFLLPLAVAQYGGSGILISYNIMSWILTALMMMYGAARYRILEWKPLFPFLLKLAIPSLAVVVTSASIDILLRSTQLTGILLYGGDLLLASAVALPVMLLMSRLCGLEETREMEQFAVSRLRFLRSRFFPATAGEAIG